MSERRGNSNSAVLEMVDGFGAAAPLQSQVTAGGQLKLELIEGVNIVWRVLYLTITAI
jgi:hypothetical protein